jgi:DnaK suppressor protein
MAAAKKKAPAKKQKTVAVIKVAKQTTSKKAVKAKAKVKAVKASAVKKAKVQVKPKAKAVKATAKTGAKKVTKQTTSKKTAKAKVVVKAKAKKTGAVSSKKKTVPQKKAVTKKPERKVIAAKQSAAPKKVMAPVAPAADRFRGLKSMLIAKRDALLKEAKQEIQKYVSGENRQLVDTAIDEADWAAVEISEDINLKRLSAQRQLLNDVEECLRKVNEGTYGICEDCAEEISEKRLRVIPTATLCIDCKEQREKMAILDQDTEI